jgi:Peptidase M15
MPNTMATGINGYHLGRWPKAADGIVPRGFIEVPERLSDFPLSPHLRLSDFVVHDSQDRFPKYLHVREALLDKVELVVAEIAQMRGRNPSLVKLNVASGFRSPAHNDEVSGTAQDSRHMYGDAADIAIDANNDGKLTEIDARLVAAAAEVVERKYPDLVGGVGLYITTEGAGWPYVHIDTRGKRARWRGGVKRGGAIDSLPDNATFDSVATAAASAPQPATHKPASHAAAPKRPATALSRHSAAAHSRSGPARAKPSTAAHSRARAATRKPAATTRAKPRAATASPPAAAHPASDDPFSSAARKFRTPRP